MGERATKIERDRATCPVCGRIIRFEMKLVGARYRPLLFGAKCVHYKIIVEDDGWWAVWRIPDE